jgi:hypothetical protein
MTTNSNAGITRRSFIVDSAALVATAQMALSAQSLHGDAPRPSAGQSAVNPLVPPKTEPFSPTDVRLLDGPFKESRDAAARYLLSLDVDRLLAPYRAETESSTVSRLGDKLPARSCARILSFGNLVPGDES